MKTITMSKRAVMGIVLIITLVLFGCISLSTQLAEMRAELVNLRSTQLDMQTTSVQSRTAARQSQSPAAVVGPSRSGVRWAVTNNCGPETPECVGQVDHGCGPQHSGVACGQGLFCNGQWCHEGCEDTPVRSGNDIERVEGMCDYLPCEISWLFDDGSPEPSGACTEHMSIQRMLLLPTVPTPANQPYFANPDTFFDTEIQQMPAQRADTIAQDLDTSAPQQLLSSHHCANGDLFTAHSESDELMSKSCTLKNVGMRADGTILYIVDDLNTTPVSTFEHSTFIWTDTNRPMPSKVRVNVEVVEVGSTAFDGMIVNPALLVWHTHWINFGHFHNEGLIGLLPTLINIVDGNATHPGDWKNTHIMLMASSPSFKSSFHDLLRGISNKAGLMWTELLQAFGQRQAVMFATLAVGILNSNPLPASYATLNAYGWFPHPHTVDTPAVRKPWWRLLRREMLAAFGVPEFGGEVSATLQLPVQPPTIQGGKRVAFVHDFNQKRTPVADLDALKMALQWFADRGHSVSVVNPMDLGGLAGQMSLYRLFDVVVALWGSSQIIGFYGDNSTTQVMLAPPCCHCFDMPGSMAASSLHKVVRVPSHPWADPSVKGGFIAGNGAACNGVQSGQDWMGSLPGRAHTDGWNGAYCYKEQQRIGVLELTIALSQSLEPATVSMFADNFAQCDHQDDTGFKC